MEEYELIGQGISGCLLDQDPAGIQDIAFDVGEGVRLPAFYKFFLRQIDKEELLGEYVFLFK